MAATNSRTMADVRRDIATEPPTGVALKILRHVGERAHRAGTDVEQLPGSIRAVCQPGTGFGRFFEQHDGNAGQTANQMDGGQRSAETAANDGNRGMTHG